jgi:hypothetical protein
VQHQLSVLNRNGEVIEFEDAELRAAVDAAIGAEAARS